MSPDPTHAATRAAEAIRRVASVEFHGPRTTDGDELAAIIAAHVPPDTPLNAVEAARECASEALAIKMYDRKVDADVFLAILRKHSDAHGPGAEARRHLERLLDCISETRGKDAYEAVAEARTALELAARINTGQDCPAENHGIACAALEALEAVRDPAGGETPETDALMTLIRDTGESIWQAGRLNEGCLFGPIPHDMDLIREKIAALERRARRAEEALAGLSAQPVSLNSNHQSGTITP